MKLNMAVKKILNALTIALATCSVLHAACVKHPLWDGILKAYVDKDGYVDYAALAAGKSGDLNKYLASLEKVDLSKCSKPEKMAFWINAYNAHMVNQVLKRPKMKKVSEDFGLFDERMKVAKLEVSLNDIEHRILRSDPNRRGPIEDVSLSTLDPRIHFALVCAALDCPKLLDRAYVASDLEEVLQENAVSFANNPKHLRVEKGKLIVSALMKWYAEDFERLGGAKDYLISLVNSERRPDAAEIISKLKTDFPDKVQFQYDWTLNSVHNKK